MEKQPLFKGEEIFELIPQRAPIVMVDTLYEADDMSGKTGLTISSDNIFCRDSYMQEPGLIEHIAQSAAAFAGYKTFKAGLPPKLGFIGEIKKCKISTLPKAGETLVTNLKVLGEAIGITLVSAETSVGDSVIVSCQMKIFIQE